MLEWIEDKNKDGDSVLHLDALKNNIKIIKITPSPNFYAIKSNIKRWNKCNWNNCQKSNISRSTSSRKFFCRWKNEFKSINEFTEQFLNIVKSLFEGDISRFIGTPLQLHLLLGAKTFIENFVQWTYNTKQSFNFDYIGIDM